MSNSDLITLIGFGISAFAIGFGFGFFMSAVRRLYNKI